MAFSYSHTIGSKKTDHNVDPWINKYIFPNGCLPSVRQIAEASESHFVMEDWHNFGADYDTTLMAWHERFINAWPEIAGNYNERFKRMFSYYLNACARCVSRARYPALAGRIYARGLKTGCAFLANHHPRITCGGLLLSVSYYRPEF
ncbi:cyclopropane-fatty-acyl-phospholipid synthase [Salmonella enterica subsp. arizonae]|uniref:Cyclopropane-fatty-acyl-phospholipid synthase n=1 Tax=Salmonella enterica subsp. arizonae TaxID=59203 RepID=A0A379SI45_SALER|nr:cyclopropane-fatty-acyl-phospholipid synthase [Salmonella enterica subsp. arizonae]